MNTPVPNVLSFEESLSFGHEAENRVARVLYQHGAWVQRCNAGNKYDLQACPRGGLGTRIEVKNEDNYAHTGNIFIETQQGIPPKPSGIMVTESDVMLHTLGENVVLYLPKCMKLHLAAIKAESNLAEGSDNNNCGIKINYGYLMKHYDCSSWFDLKRFEELHASRLFYRR